MSRLHPSLCIVAAACLALATGNPGVHAQEARPADRAAARPCRVLYLTHSQGYNHSVLGLSEKILTELGRKTNAFKLTALAGYKQDPDKIDLSRITPAFLKQFDAIVFYTSGQLPLTDDQKKAIVDFVKSGKGFVGIHAATDTFRETPDAWPEFGEMIGARFKKHGPRNDVPVVITIDEPGHPVTRMLPAEWKIADEIYQFVEPVPRDKFRVVMSIHADKLDEAALKAHAMQKGKTYEVAWCREYGKGRTFYTSLGHRDDVWTNPLYQEHLVAGIRWVMGDVPDSSATRKPQAGFWADFQKGREGAKISIAQAAVNPAGPFAAAIETYRLDTGAYPEKLADLVNKPSDEETAKKWNGPYFKDAKSLKDPWGQEILFKMPGKHKPETYDLWSAGPDGQSGTSDDIGNWAPPRQSRRGRS